MINLMRTCALIFFILLYQTPLTSTAAEIFREPYLNQSSHRETLLFQGWDGAYIESLYVTHTDTVIFDYCRPSPNRQQFNKVCSRAHKNLIPREALDYYQNRLIRQLAAYRRQLAQDVDANFFGRLLGGSKNDSNILGLDALIAAMEMESLKFLILQGPQRPERPALRSLSVMDKIANIWEEVFSKPYWKPGQPMASLDQ